MFHVHLDYFQKSPLGSRPNTKPRDHGTLNAHNGYFILFYHVWGPAWIEIHWNNSWLRAWSHTTSHYTWESVTTLHDFGGVLGLAFEHFLLGNHNFMVINLGSYVKWPLVIENPNCCLKLVSCVCIVLFYITKLLHLTPLCPIGPKKFTKAQYCPCKNKLYVGESYR